MVEAFVYCWQVMRIWERKERMGKPMMPIWMMTGVLTMSKAVGRMLCWPPANWQLSVSAEVHGSCCGPVCPSAVNLSERSQATVHVDRQMVVFVVSAARLNVARPPCVGASV